MRIVARCMHKNTEDPALKPGGLGHQYHASALCHDQIDQQFEDNRSVLDGTWMWRHKKYNRYEIANRLNQQKCKYMKHPKHSFYVYSRMLPSPPGFLLSWWVLVAKSWYCKMEYCMIQSKTLAPWVSCLLPVLRFEPLEFDGCYCCCYFCTRKCMPSLGTNQG